MPINMSSQAIDARLRRVSELRRLFLILSRAKPSLTSNNISVREATREDYGSNKIA